MRRGKCILVIIGATPEGTKELLGFTDGSRESAHDWRVLLLARELVKAKTKAAFKSIAPKVATEVGRSGAERGEARAWMSRRAAHC